MIYQQMALYYIRNMFLLILSVWGGPKKINKPQRCITLFMLNYLFTVC